MNVKKTKTMVISRVENHRVDILMNNEQINSFTYHGQAITSDATNDTEIIKQIALAKSLFVKWKNCSHLNN